MICFLGIAWPALLIISCAMINQALKQRYMRNELIEITNEIEKLENPKDEDIRGLMLAHDKYAAVFSKGAETCIIASFRHPSHIY